MATNHESEKAEQLAERIANDVNSRVNPDPFKDAVQRKHNALQRLMFDEVFKPGIIALAGTPTTDRRNRNTVDQCQAICDVMGWEY